jgi:hypothetical protein
MRTKIPDQFGYRSQRVTPDAAFVALRHGAFSTKTSGPTATLGSRSDPHESINWSS